MNWLLSLSDFVTWAISFYLLVKVKRAKSASRVLTFWALGLFLYALAGMIQTAAAYLPGLISQIWIILLNSWFYWLGLIFFYVGSMILVSHSRLWRIVFPALSISLVLIFLYYGLFIWNNLEVTMFIFRVFLVTPVISVLIAMFGLSYFSAAYLEEKLLASNPGLLWMAGAFTLSLPIIYLSVASPESISLGAILRILVSIIFLFSLIKLVKPILRSGR